MAAKGDVPNVDFVQSGTQQSQEYLEGSGELSQNVVLPAAPPLYLVAPQDHTLLGTSQGTDPLGTAQLGFTGTDPLGFQASQPDALGFQASQPISLLPLDLQPPPEPLSQQTEGLQDFINRRIEQKAPDGRRAFDLLGAWASSSAQGLAPSPAPTVPMRSIPVDLAAVSQKPVHHSLMKAEHTNSRAARRGPMDEMRQVGRASRGLSAPLFGLHHPLRGTTSTSTHHQHTPASTPANPGIHPSIPRHPP